MCACSYACDSLPIAAGRRRFSIPPNRLLDNHRVERKAAMKVALADTDAEIEPVPTDAHVHKAEPERDPRLASGVRLKRSARRATTGPRLLRWRES